jgi:RimJ/RimL family protein N-acetyltransferase
MTMTYACLQQQVFSKGDYKIVPFRQQDLMDIKSWRNEQIQYLRQKEPLTDGMQQHYYQSTILPSFTEKEPRQILFSFLDREMCIGYGGIVHIDWLAQRGEVSFLLDTQHTENQEQYHEEFSIFLQLIKQAAFEDLKFHRLFTETYNIRPQHIATLEQQGFVFEGNLREHVFIHDRFVDSLIHGCIAP